MVNVFKIGFRKYIIGLNCSKDEPIKIVKILKSEFPKIKFVVIGEP